MNVHRDENDLRSATGASEVARTLRARGVSTIFTLCGDHTNPLLDACDEAGIRIVDARDERGAAWMAAGWALATAKPGVVVISNTPALTNAATALADSTFSGIPVLCVTGGVGLDDRGKGHPGDQDQVAIATPITKWAARATQPDNAAALIIRSFEIALAPRPGAVVVELPLDIQQRGVEPISQTPPLRDVETPNVAEIRARLSRAQRPVMIAGSGCFWDGAGDALRALAEGARIPVFTARAARGLLSDDHELCMGFPNLLAPAAQTIFGEADVALVVGAELDVLMGNGAFHPGCTLIRIDADPGAFAIGRHAEIELIASPRATLELLAAGAQPLDTDGWVKRLRDAVDVRAAEVAKRAQIASSPLHPGRLMAEVSSKLPADAIVTVDAGELALWAIDAIPARAPSSFHTSSASAMGALGMGLPWAIGMKAARPERPVVALCGDGSFGFTAMELETSARHGLPVGVVIGNDGGWGIVRHLQNALHGRTLATDLPVAPYELLAEFAGGVGDRVEAPKQLEIAITNALVASRPSVINAILDRSIEHEAMPLIAAMFAARQAGV
jgi:thiamine pyrophosphate-dependent acetolactate synthase large subunit-like protein